MQRFFISKLFLLFILLLFFSVASFLILQFIFPASSKADTYYKSINCPTPGIARNSLQLIPCTPASAVTQPAYTAQTRQQPNNTATLPVPNTQNGTIQSGSVCTPDSTIGSGAACKCQSDLAPDALCTTPNISFCTQNGGAPANYVNLFTGKVSPVSSINGPIQCIWEWTASVPKAAEATNCSIECNSKPVLYFYSPASFSINVLLDIPGFVTASNPIYPANGWQNVIIHPQGTPDGTLLYNKKTYKELYYEDETIKAQAPTTGFVIKTHDLSSSLRTYTAKLGLNVNEQNEFISYWIPRLNGLHSPYIFFSVFDQQQKEKVDHVIVSPKPETTIAFLAYFKPLSNPINVTPLQFPSIPSRVGFTMVEWGGTIENN